MSYSYNRSASRVGPLTRVLDRWWNQVHDLEAEIEAASKEYQHALSDHDKEGEAGIKAILKAVEDTTKKIRQLTDGGNSAFADLQSKEEGFVKKHGLPSEYIQEQQDRMGLR